MSKSKFEMRLTFIIFKLGTDSTKTLMKIYKDYVKLLKIFGVTFIGTSAGWMYYQIKKTRFILEHTLDTSVLSLKNVSEHAETESEEYLNLESFYPYEKRNVFQTTWDTIKFAYARRVIRVANSNDKEFRIKAIANLSKVKNLDQWHCSLLASMMDPRVAVALARSRGADKRMLLEPPLRYHNYNNVMLINAMRDLLIGLYEKSQHACLGYFLSKVFVYEQNNVHIVDDVSSALELSKFIQSESDVMPKCLESLLHHSKVLKYARDIVDMNGLPLLMEIYHRNKKNIDITIKLCQMLSHMSYDKSLLEPIYRSGWVAILSEWINHDDVRVSIPAAKTLANLDFDNEHEYSSCLYLLSPLTRSTKDREVDVIFIHGLLGGVFYTWRQRNKDIQVPGFVGKKNGKETIMPLSCEEKSNTLHSKPTEFLRELQDQIENEELNREFQLVLDDIPVSTNTSAEGPFTCSLKEYKRIQKEYRKYTQCWPKDWLPRDCRNLRIIGVNYNTSLSMWASICPSEKGKFTLNDHSQLLLEKLQNAGVGNRPIVWIAHSMGGLIVKNMLTKALESSNPLIKNISLNTKGIVFYSTPHKGSRLAKLNQAAALLLWPSVEVQELREGSPQLREIHEKFLKLTERIPMKIITFVETNSTILTALKLNFLLVEPHSGNPGVGEYFEVPQDHLSICKPLSRCSFLYQKVLHLIREVLAEAQRSKSGNI